MSAIAPDKQEIIKELYSRRDSLTPEKRAIIEELATRTGISTPAPVPTAADFFKARGAFEDARGGVVSRAVGSAVDTGVGMAKGLYHAATDPATAEEMKQFGNQPGPAELILKRTLVDPSVENYRKMQAAPNWQGKVGYGLGMIPIAGPMGTSLGETAASKGLPEAIGQAGMYAAAPKIIEKTMDVAGAIADRAPGAIAGAPKTAADFLRDRFKPTPGKTLLRATGSSNPELIEKIPIAGDELAAWSDSTAKPVDSAPVAREAIDARIRHYNEISDQIAGPQSDVVVPGSRAGLAQAKIEAIPDEVRLNQPRQYANKVKAIQDAAAGPEYTIGDLDALRKDLQAKNKSYGKNLSGQISAEHSNQAVDMAAEHYARGKFYDALEQNSGDISVKELKSRIGALIELDNALRPRINQSIIESGKSFLQKGMETAGKAMTPGTTLKHFGENATIDSDIASAMRQWTRRPTPIEVTPPKLPAPAPISSRLALPPATKPFQIDPSAAALYGTDPTRILRQSAQPGEGIPMRDVTPVKPKMLNAAPSPTTRIERSSGKVWNMPAPVKALLDQYIQGQKRLGSGVQSSSAAVGPTAADLLRSRFSQQAPLELVHQMAEAHMRDYAETIEGGATQDWGKAKRMDPEAERWANAGEELRGRIGGDARKVSRDPGLGTKKGTPFEKFPESPAELAAAYRRGKGPLYERMMKASIELSQSQADWELLKRQDRFKRETDGWD